MREIRAKDGFAQGGRARVVGAARKKCDFDLLFTRLSKLTAPPWQALKAPSSS